MAEAGIEAKFKSVLNGVSKTLTDLGFRRRASSWRWLADGNCALVEAQRSRTNTAKSIRFTFNVGIISGRLLAEDWSLEVSRAGCHHAHLRDRVGFFLPDSEDAWWTVDEHARPQVLVDELAPLLERAAFFLRQNVSDAQLINLWQTGRSPGLTEHQRKRNLRMLTFGS